jgi:hypothetical protein
VVTVQARVAGGQPARNRSCTVSSSNTLVATVNPSTGTTDTNGDLSITVSRILFITTGTVTISATCEGVSTVQGVTTSSVEFR